jgi:hypothetical protein
MYVCDILAKSMIIMLSFQKSVDEICQDHALICKIFLADKIMMQIQT